MTKIDCNIGVAFVEDGKLLLITKNQFIAVNTRLYEKYQYCVEIDLTGITHRIDAITSIYINNSVGIISLEDNTIYIRAKLVGIYLDKWTIFKFANAVAKLIVDPDCVCLLDVDDNIWTCQYPIYNQYENYCEFVDVGLVDKDKAVVVDFNVGKCANIVFTGDGQIFSLHQTYDQYICRKYYSHLPQIEMIHRHNDNIVFLDINGQLYISDGMNQKILQYDGIITNFAITGNGIFFLSENKLFYKCFASYSSICQIKSLPTDLEIIDIVSSSNTIFVVMTDGIVIILYWNYYDIRVECKIQTDHNFAPQQIKSASKI